MGIKKGENMDERILLHVGCNKRDYQKNKITALCKYIKASIKLLLKTDYTDEFTESHEKIMDIVSVDTLRHELISSKLHPTNKY